MTAQPKDDPRAVVLDHEVVTRTFPEGPGSLQVMMIYEVANGDEFDHLHHRPGDLRR